MLPILQETISLTLNRKLDAHFCTVFLVLNAFQTQRQLLHFYGRLRMPGLSKKIKGLERNTNRGRGPEVASACTELVPRCTLLHPEPAACFSQLQPLRPPQPRASSEARTRRTETEHPPRCRVSPSLSQNRSGGVPSPTASQWGSSIFVTKPALQ